MKKPIYNRLLGVIARAASPHERRECGAFQKKSRQNIQTLLRRKQAWMSRAGKNGISNFYSLLKARGISRNEFLHSLCDVRVANPEKLPPWATTLIMLFEHANYGERRLPPFFIPTGEEKLLPWAYQTLFEPFLKVADAQLRELILKIGLDASSRAHQEMLGSLVGRWNVVSMLALEHRPHIFTESVRQVFFKEGVREGESWLQLFEQYPVLARLLAVVFMQWKNQISEILSRLAENLTTISKIFFEDSPPGALMEYTVAAPETHNGGRTVVLLRFENGGKIVYKPKDIRLAFCFSQLVHACNGSGLMPPLYAHKILAGSRYAFEEYVEHAPCATRAEVERYYARLGMWLCLLQWLDGSDFIADNIRAFGEHPVLVDLEGLFSPRLTGARRGTLGKKLAEKMADSPLKTGILPRKIAGDTGRKAMDAGVVARHQLSQSPFLQRFPLQGEHGNFIAEQGYLTLESPHCFPTRSGKSVSPCDYVESFIRGYKDFFRFMQKNKKLFTSKKFLSNAGAGSSRFFYRNTHVYERFLLQSFAPRNLVDGIQGELYLERLWRAYSQSRKALDVVPQEIEELRDTDIPLFLSRPGSDSLFYTDGTEKKGFFEGKAAHRLVERFRRLEQTDMNEHEDLIRSAFFTLDEASTPRAKAQKRRQRINAIRTESINWLSEAVKIGKFISRQAVRADGQLAWVGLTYRPWADVRKVQPLKDDLFSGTAGLSIVFSDLFRFSGIPEFKENALAILKCTRTDFIQELSGIRQPFFCGAFYGPGAQLYALSRSQKILRHFFLDRKLCMLLAHGAQEIFNLSASADMVCGKAGFLLALLAVYKNQGWKQLSKPLFYMARQLTQLREVPFPPYPPDTAVLEGLPGTPAGVLYAVLKTLSILEKQIPVSHRSVYETCLSNGNCSSGELITRLALSAFHVERSATLDRDVTAYLERSPDELSSVELLEAVEVALTAFQFRNKDRFHARARDFAAGLRLRHRETGKWFPDILAADRHNLSAVTGISAIAHAFLKLHSPEKIPSLRLLG